MSDVRPEWERKKSSADTRNSRDDEGLPEDPGQGIQVKRNIAKIREVALLDSVENSWAGFTRQVEELLNQTSDPSISLHDRLKAFSLYVVLKSKFHDRGKYMQSYKVAANALAKRVDEGRANVAKAYVDKQVREFFKEVGFPLVARKASVSLLRTRFVTSRPTETSFWRN